MQISGKRLLSALLAAAVAISMLPASALAAGSPARKAATEEDYTRYVNPFVGTQLDGGQLFPGALSPSGLVKLSPDTYPHDNNDHAGYDYKKTQITGFSHTRVEGVGGDGAGGDVLVSPTYLTFTAKPNEAQRALRYTHAAETAEPGYYQVDLTPKLRSGNSVTTAPEDFGKIRAEMTASTNVGYHLYTFPKAGRVALTFDLGYGYNLKRGKSSTLTVKNEADKTTLQGTLNARTVGDKTTYKLYYYAETKTKPADVMTWSGSTGELDEIYSRSGSDVGAVLSYDVEDGGTVELKVALSAVSPEQAKRDLQSQAPGWDFSAMRAAAKADWNRILGRVSIQTADRDALEQKYDELYESFYKQGGNKPDAGVYAAGGSMQAQAELSEAEEDARLKTLFYTHLYHMFTTPVNATSSDRTFKVSPTAVKEADDFTYYDSWSLWDDFRKYPVLGLVAPDIYADQIRSIAYLAEFGSENLYNNTLSTNTVPTVRAEHAVALLADGVAKGLVDVDNMEAAYEKFKTVSNNRWGAAALSRGYAGSVGDTVENSYDDWCLSLLAKALGKTSDFTTYAARALNYRNLFRPDAVTKRYTRDGQTVTDSISMLWPKNDDGSWRNADPEAYEGGGYQGTIWQYSLWDSQDIAGLMKLMGDGDATAGKAKFLTYLRYLYGMNVSDNASARERMNAMLHSNTNEIDLQTPYMFNVAGKPSLTQYWTRQIYTKATWNSYSGTGRNNTAETNNAKPVYAYKLDPYGFMETMDDDCGTMAGNFVAAAMGLYPMTPGDTTYQIGSPFFEEMTIDLQNGKTFTIKANGVSSKNFYIQSATLNGEPLNRSWIDYSEIVRGGVLEFVMGDTPSTWAEDGVSVPALDDLNGGTVAEYLHAPAVSYSATKVSEAAADDGSIADTVTVTAKNGVRFSGANGEDFAANGKLTARNLPEGLTLRAIRDSETQITLSFTGRATVHSADVNNLILAFSDDAFDGQTASAVTGSVKSGLDALTLDFISNIRERLRAAIEAATQADAATYTAASIAKLKTAAQDAQAVADNTAATEAQLKAAYEAVATARAALALRSTTSIYIEAEDYTAATDGANPYHSDRIKNEGTNVGGTFDGAWLRYDDVDFSMGITQVAVNYAHNSGRCGGNAKIVFKLDSLDGETFAEVALPTTGSNWDTYKTVTDKPLKQVSGVHDLYILLSAQTSTSNPFVANLNYYEFSGAGSKRLLNESIARAEAELSKTLTYTQASMDALRAALEAAKQVAADDFASQSEINTARTRITNAIRGLKAFVRTTGIQLSAGALTLRVGATAQLTATALVNGTPSTDPANNSFTFTSSNTRVLTVSATGLIRAVAAGKATVTVRSTDGSTVTAVCNVEVTAPPNHPANGTETVGGKTVLYVNGKPITGTTLAAVGSTTYAVVGGTVSTGSGNHMVTIAKTTYIANAKGAVQKASKKARYQLLKIGKKGYIVGTTGAVQKSKSAKTGKLFKVGKKRYIVNQKGLVRTAKKKYLLVKAGKRKYIVNKSGVVQVNKKKLKVGKVVYKTGKTGIAKKKKK